MAYDLYVGKGNKVKHNPDLVGSIDFDELVSLSRLLQRKDSFFLHRISNIFEDQSFFNEEIEQALSHLFPLLKEKLRADEQAILHKLISVLSYAKVMQLGLHGIAD